MKLKRKFIQIVIDNKYREIYAAILLKKYIEAKQDTIYVLISNKLNMKIVHDAYNPSVVLLPHAKGYMNIHIAYMRKVSQIVLLPSGGTNVSDESIERQYFKYTDIETREHIRRIYLWGSRAKQYLLKKSGYREDQLLISGNPRFDMMQCLNASMDTQKDGEKFLGIGTVSKHVTNIHDLSIIDLIEVYSKKFSDTSKNIYWREGGNYADYIWHEVNFLETIIAIVKMIKEKKNNEKIMLRPHPFETIKTYEKWIKKNKYNIQLCKNLSLTTYFQKTYAYISLFSTSAIEALLMGVPGISLKKLLGNRVANFIREDLYNFELEQVLWQPETLDELGELIEKARCGQLPISPCENQMRTLFAEICALDQKQTATEIIGDDIIDITNQTDLNHVNSAKLMKRICAEIYFRFFSYPFTPYHYVSFSHFSANKRFEISKINLPFIKST